MTSGLDAWRPNGRICIWRYKPMLKMYAGWHFAADSDGRRALIDLFEPMGRLKQPGRRTMPVSDPVAVGVDRIFGAHALGVQHPSTLRIAFDPNRSDTDPHVEIQDDRFVLTTGPNSIERIRDAVADVARGHADFGIGLCGPASSGMDTIQFWWWPEAR
jgi:hypothetical protein